MILFILCFYSIPFIFLAPSPLSLSLSFLVVQYLSSWGTKQAGTSSPSLPPLYSCCLAFLSRKDLALPSLVTRRLAPHCALLYNKNGINVIKSVFFGGGPKCTTRTPIYIYRGTHPPPIGNPEALTPSLFAKEKQTRHSDGGFTRGDSILQRQVVYIYIYMYER